MNRERRLGPLHFALGLSDHRDGDSPRRPRLHRAWLWLPLINPRARPLYSGRVTAANSAIMRRYLPVLCLLGAGLASLAHAATPTGTMPVTPTRDVGAASAVAGAPAPPMGNPLWGISLNALTATRERPIFSPSRRPPAPTPPALVVDGARAARAVLGAGADSAHACRYHRRRRQQHRDLFQPVDPRRGPVADRREFPGLGPARGPWPRSGF